MAKILVTGGLGFIGSEFVNANCEKHDIVVLDLFTYAADINRLSIAAVENSSIIEGDINDIEHLAMEHPGLCEVDYVVNFAAESHVDNSIKDSQGTYKSNLNGTVALLNFYKDLDITKFVQISTDEVYGDMADLRPGSHADETFNLRPSSPYSASKAAADLAVLAYARTYDLPFLITRSCNNFGPKQNPEKLIPMMFKKIREGKTIPIYGDGQQRREWIHVNDNVEIISRLMFSEEANDQIFNIGSGFSYKNLQIIEMVRRYMDYKKVKLDFVKDRLGHDVVYALNCDKLAEFIGDDFPFLPLETFIHSMVTSHNFNSVMNE